MEGDIVERLRKWDTFWEDDLLVAADEIERLRAELAAAIKQRDEARREYCEASADLASRPISPEKIAANRGWDCFEKEDKT